MSVTAALPPMVDGEFRLTREDFETLAHMLHEQTGITLHEGKATLLYSRLGKRLRARGMPDFRAYCALLANPAESEERGAMMRALTTNVTRFFREPHHFEHLQHVVLPPLLHGAERGGRVRLWSAACSTGQEPYTMALTVLRLLPQAMTLDVRILATDVDTSVLEQARAGRYSDEAIDQVPSDCRRWFERAGDSWRVGEALRRLVVFRPLNLVREWPMRGPFDAILCRNVVIYFSEVTQQEIWNRMVPMLVPGGHLYIGHSERLSGPAAALCDSVGVTSYCKRVQA